MNTDFRISVSFPHHPKTKKLIRKIGHEGVFSLVSLWAFTAANKSKGIFTSMDADDIEIAANWEGEPLLFISTLIDLKFLTKKKGIYSIHDWKDHNSYAFFSEERSSQAKKAAGVRWKKKHVEKEKNAGSIKQHCSKQESALPKNDISNAPLPYPSPLPKNPCNNKSNILDSSILLESSEFEPENFEPENTCPSCGCIVENSGMCETCEKELTP